MNRTQKRDRIYDGLYLLGQDSKTFAEGSEVLPRRRCTLGLHIIWDMASKGQCQATAWYTKAADQGEASVQMMLGQAYAYGDGTEPEASKGI